MITSASVRFVLTKFFTKVRLRLLGFGCYKAAARGWHPRAGISGELRVFKVPKTRAEDGGVFVIGAHFMLRKAGQGRAGQRRCVWILILDFLITYPRNNATDGNV
jgi:hypothetical protein